MWTTQGGTEATIRRPHHVWGRLRGGVLAVIVTTALAVLVTPAESAPSDHSTSPVFTIPPPGPSMVGSSHLVRTDDGLSLRLETSDLEPDHAVTMWIVVANSPDQCESGLPGLSRCGPADHQARRGDISVHQAGGRIVDEGGTARYGAHLQVGDTSDALFEVDPGLIDARGAEVLVILKTHGPKIPELTSQMLSTFAAGCQEAPLPPELEPREELIGTLGQNECAEVQISVHQGSS